MSSVYPHYYAWWVYVNYLNDDFYEQCAHQLIFTVELPSRSLNYYLVYSIYSQLLFLAEWWSASTLKIYCHPGRDAQCGCIIAAGSYLNDA